MHYQWGRKDPFTPSSATAYSEVQIYNATGNPITKGTNGIGTTDEQFKFEARTITTQTTVGDLIQNPSTHYDKGDGANYVSIASAGYNNTTREGDWWNPTIKTLYDPCPNGYRIPKSGTYGEASDWTISNPYSVATAGYTWNHNNNVTFFPASGVRDGTYGGFWGLGTSGYAWMSTHHNPDRGYFLDFYPDRVNTNTITYNSYGLPTRCIKD